MAYLLFHHVPRPKPTTASGNITTLSQNSVLRRCGFDAEASAVDVDSTRNSKRERPQEGNQKQIGQDGGAGQTPTAQDK
jgi:hypothetical protein